MLSRRSFVLAAALSAATSFPVGAQLAGQAAIGVAPRVAYSGPELPTPDSTPVAPAAPTTAVAAPLVSALPIALRPATSAAALSLDQEQAALRARARGGFSHSQVLMIVGGAAFLTGLIIGDDAGDVLAIGGAGVGLYGLYRYLQER